MLATVARRASRAQKQAGAREEPRRERPAGDSPFDQAIADHQAERPDDKLRQERQRPEEPEKGVCADRLLVTLVTGVASIDRC
jgi:hypothetical protein